MTQTIREPRHRARLPDLPVHQANQPLPPHFAFNMKHEPTQILRNLRSIMQEAEDLLTRGAEVVDAESLLELKDRMQASLHKLRDAWEETGERIGDQYRHLEERVTDCCNGIENSVRTRVEDTDQTIRSHPYEAIVISFGVGLVAGALIGALRR
jgi:ElaB/YqjD/DUF883 family membrane-anchored ribosome-binding protein